MSQSLATYKWKHQGRLLDMPAWTKSTEKVLESHGRRYITTHYIGNQGGAQNVCGQLSPVFQMAGRE